VWWPIMRRPILQILNDELLIEQVKKGSQEAFSQLVDRHQTSVYSLCHRMTGDRAEAEDLAQESFFRAYKGLDSFRKGARLKPWLLKIAANACLDLLRKKKQETLSLDSLMIVEDGPFSLREDEHPENAYLLEEARGNVQTALLHLPADYRIVLVLRYLEDLSYREVADTLGVTLSTVETRIYRAKKALARMLVSPGERGEKEACSELCLE
jgi:RNA polymerase sigma-70 factor, ECF subfamily